jgi:Mitochondrial import receptor subunit Tom22
MGGVTSKIDQQRLNVAKNRVHKLSRNAWWLGGHLVWTAVTAAIVLAVPVFFEYERECQMFEQMQQMQAAQMHAAESAFQ